jgi:hypothetical protein
MTSKTNFSFDLKAKTSVSDEELRKKASQTRFLTKPGEYVLTIKDREITKINDKDPNWFNAMVQTESADGFQFRIYPLIPKTAANNFAFKSPTMKDPSDFAFQGIYKFLSGLGVQVEDFNDLPAICAELFQGSDMIKEKQIRVVIGYKGIHIRYIGLDDNGDATYQAYRDEEVFSIGEDENKQVSPILPDRDAVLNWLLGLNIEEKKISKFPEILKYLKAPQQINVLDSAGPEASAEVVENPFES